MDNKLVSRMNKVGKVGKIITIIIIVMAILSAIETLVGDHRDDSSEYGRARVSMHGCETRMCSRRS